jgi:putative ABC transport system permease protein
MASFWRDLRYGWRMLAKAPGHTLAAAVALSLGIGLTTACFSIVYGVLWRGLPYPGAERLVQVDTQNPSRELLYQGVGVHDYLDWCRRQRSFVGLAGYTNGTVTVSGDGHPERLDGSALTANALDLLAVKPVLGRGFRTGEDHPGATPVVLLGYRLWQNRYSGDPGIVGKAVRINGRQTTVIGVMAADFRFPGNEQLWTPLLLDPARSARGKDEPFTVFGRLRPGVTTDQAAAEMAAIARALAVEFPRTNRGFTATVEPIMHRFVDKQGRYLLYTMLVAVCCVLLIACINVASLVMSRASQRTREMAIRTALGAARRQVIGQILTESLILALLGSAVGLGLAWEGIALFNAAIVDKDPPTWIHIALDLPALLFALAATLAAAVASGLVPALQVSRTELNEVLKDEGRGSTSLRLGWLSRAVVVAELALSCALLVATGLMVKSMILAREVHLGFATARMLTVRVPLFEANYPRPVDRGAFYQRLLERLREKPGVEAVGATSVLPSISWDREAIAVDGRAYATDADYPVAHSDVVSEGLFATLGTRLLEGREFERLDTATSQPVAIVNRSMAQKMWPGADPLGKRFRRARTTSDEPWRTVVGVVPDLMLYGVTSDGTKKQEGFFLPVTQVGAPRLSFVLRTQRDPLSLVPMVRAEVTALDKDTPLYFIRTMEEAVALDRYFNNLFSSMFALFGLSALVLAAVGIYGVIAFSVQRRTQEIGLRLALGAQRGEVLRMLLRQAVIQLGLGLVIGMPMAIGVSQGLTDFLYPAKPGDPAVFALVAAGLAMVALVACLVPGQRAMDVDPNVALRYDA